MFLLTNLIKVTDVHIFHNDNEIFYIKESYMKLKIPDCNENHDYYEFFFDTEACDITIKDIQNFISITEDYRIAKEEDYIIKCKADIAPKAALPIDYKVESIVLERQVTKIEFE